MNLLVHGVPATVTIPGGDPVMTRLLWTRSSIGAPAELEIQQIEARRVAVLPKIDVPAVPRGTLISAPETQGGTNRLWRVDAPDQIHEPELHRFIVLSV